MKKVIEVKLTSVNTKLILMNKNVLLMKKTHNLCSGHFLSLDNEKKLSEKEEKNYDVEDIIKKVIGIMDNKYGEGSGLSGLEYLVYTGDYGAITSTDNARKDISSIPLKEVRRYFYSVSNSANGWDLLLALSNKYGCDVAIEKMQLFLDLLDQDDGAEKEKIETGIVDVPVEEIKDIINIKNVFDYVKECLINKYGDNTGMIYFNSYVNTGNTDYLNKDKEIKQIVEQFSDDDLNLFRMAIKS